MYYIFKAKDWNWSHGNHPRFSDFLVAHLSVALTHGCSEDDAGVFGSLGICGEDSILCPSVFMNVCVREECQPHRGVKLSQLYR